MPVTQVRQLYANFPENHPLWVGNTPAGTLNSLSFPKNADVVINVGNKFQHNGPAPIVPRGPKFIDMRIDCREHGQCHAHRGAARCRCRLGLDDLYRGGRAVDDAGARAKAAERAAEVRKITERARMLRALVGDNPEWDISPLIADRVTSEVAQFADPDAIIVHEAGSVAMHSFDFNPLGGRELFFYYGCHLGSGVGTAAGVKLARPNQQVICLVGDGSFLFGPTALWNMARLELPVIVVVYNNHAYAGPHSRVVANVPGGRMVQTGQFVHDYLGNPDMNMADIARGFGVAGEVVREPGGAARGAGAGAGPHGGGQALSPRRAGRAPRRRLGRKAVGAADPGRRHAAEARVRRRDVPEQVRTGCCPRGRCCSAPCSHTQPRHGAAEADLIDQGHDLYDDICATCHGRDMVNAGGVFLRPAQVPQGRFRTLPQFRAQRQEPGHAGLARQDHRRRLCRAVGLCQERRLAQHPFSSTYLYHEGASTPSGGGRSGRA